MDVDALRRSITGAAEAGANLVTGGIMAPLAGGLAYIPAAMAGGDAAGQAVMQKVNQEFTYEPRSDAGKSQVDVRHSLMQPIHETIGSGMEGLGDAAVSAVEAVGVESDKVKGVAYAAGKTAIPAALSAIPMMRGGMVIGSSKNISFHAGRIKEGAAPVSEFSNAVLRENGDANRYGPGLYSYANQSNASSFAKEIVAGTLRSQRNSTTGPETAHIYKLRIDPTPQNTISVYRNYSAKQIDDIAARAEPYMPGISKELSAGMDGEQILGAMHDIFARHEWPNGQRKVSLAKPKRNGVGPKTMRNDALVNAGFRYIEGRIPNPNARGNMDPFDKGIVVLSPETGGIKIIDSFSIEGSVGGPAMTGGQDKKNPPATAGISQQ